MTTGCVRWLIPALLVSVALPASAENCLGIWPGMSSSEAANVLKARCPNIRISGDEEKSVTCRSGSTEITATVSTRDRIYHIAWREPSDDEVMDYVRRVAGELGLSGAGKDCKFYDYELRCWQAKDGSVLYSGERDAQKRFVSYIINDTIKEEDMGPATAAPVTPEE